jgi:hypothetical protein
MILAVPGGRHGKCRQTIQGPRAWLKSNTTETAIVDKPEKEEDEHAGHHHGHAH